MMVGISLPRGGAEIEAEPRLRQDADSPPVQLVERLDKVLLAPGLLCGADAKADEAGEAGATATAETRARAGVERRAKGAKASFGVCFNPTADKQSVVKIDPDRPSATCGSSEAGRIWGFGADTGA